MEHYYIGDIYADYDHIEHYGVPGMKWGVRRYQKKNGSLTPAGKKRQKVNYSSEAKKMSNDDLKRNIDRMNLEKRYRELTTPTSKVARAANKVEKLTNSGRDANNLYRGIKGNKDPKVKMIDQGINGISRSASAAKKIDKMSRKKNEINLDKMSDQELRDAINRIDMEKQYARLKKESVSRGKVQVSDILNVAGDVLAVGSSAATIALLIKNKY